MHFFTENIFVKKQLAEVHKPSVAFYKYGERNAASA